MRNISYGTALILYILLYVLALVIYKVATSFL
jgi:hypothetical protein